MYRCKNCNELFSEPDYMREGSGEMWSVCPYCGRNGMDELRERKAGDKFLSVEKAEVIDYVVSAIALINSLKVYEAKETLIELIRDMTDSPFEYKGSLDTVSDDEAAKELIAQIQTAVEVEVL